MSYIKFIFAIPVSILLQSCAVQKNDYGQENDHHKIIQEGYNLYEQGKYHKARQLFESAIRKDPSSKAFFYLGKLYIDTKNIPRARKILEDAKKYKENDPEILNALAVTHDLQGNHKKAQEFYLKAIKHSVEKEEYESNLGLSYVFNKNYKKSFHYLERNQKTPRQRHNLALLYALKGNKKKFYTLLEKDLPKDDIKKLFTSVRNDLKGSKK